MGFVRDPRLRIALRWLLVVLRLLMGFMWLGTGWSWVTKPDAPAYLVGAIEVSLDRAVFFYVPFLKHVVLPNVGLFAFLVAWGEFLTGVALFLGTLSRFGAGVGMFILLNYALRQGPPSFKFFIPMLAIHIAILLGAAGRTLGGDHFLHKRWPKVPLW